MTGEQTVANDRQFVVARLAAACEEHQPQVLCIDSAFGSPIVLRLKQLGYPAVEVNFGGDSPDPYCQNARAAMYRAMKEWLPHGCIDQKDHHLAADLAAPGYTINKRNKLVIEPKASIQKRGGAPLHDSDALALTFSMRVRMPKQVSTARVTMPSGAGSWMSS